ncbi:myosin-G heavy chain-like [Musca vetustissima]|uniref:myosin-G heavy chain-like n=1 Tax=Musca vetustissima TaxID=27455 RepID=UPI002AB69B06|nr:myosin-G heavy chain-like [Musca vetustissima]
MVNSSSSGNKPPKMKLKQHPQQQTENVAAKSASNENTNQAQKSTQIETNGNSTTSKQLGQKTQNGQQQQQTVTTPVAAATTTPTSQSVTQTPKQNNNNKNGNNSNNNKGRNSVNNNNNNNKSNKNKQQQQQSNSENTNPGGKAGKYVKSTSYRNSSHSYAQTVGGNSKKTYNKPQPLAAFNDNLPLPRRNSKNSQKNVTNENQNPNVQKSGGGAGEVQKDKSKQPSPADLLTAALTKSCAKCQKPTALAVSNGNEYMDQNNCNNLGHHLNPKQYRKSKSYVNSSRYSSNGDLTQRSGGSSSSSSNNHNNNRHHYHRSQSDRRNSFDRHFAERNKNFVPIEAPARPILASSNIAAVIADTEKMVIIERLGKGRHTYPIMQVSAE